MQSLCLEYVNNCFLAHFKPFIENCRAPSNEQGNDEKSTGDTLQSFMQTKIFVEYQTSKAKQEFLKKQFDEEDEKCQHEDLWRMK